MHAINALRKHSCIQIEGEDTALSVDDDALSILYKAGFKEFAAITTERTSFKLAGNISVDVDRCEADEGRFVHSVVEVEKLSSESTPSALRSASLSIDRMISSLPGVDPAGKAKGKVVAYLAQRAPAHLAHLLEVRKRAREAH